MLPTPKRSKYKAVKTVVDGRKFDSKAEARRFIELSALLQSGHISNLRCQVAFSLAPGVKFADATRIKPGIRFVADFCYLDASKKEVIEDVKGMITPVYRLKKHLMLSVLGLHVTEVK